MKKIGMIVAISFLSGAIFFALTFGFFQDSTDKGIVLSPSVASAEAGGTEPVTIEKDSQKLAMGGLNFVHLVKKVKVAVVKVTSESIVDRRQSPFGDDLFDRFFNRPGRGRQRVAGMGSGFFISADGYILTNNHLVDNAMKITVTDIDENEYPAKKIGTDPKTDLALLKIETRDHPYIELGDSEKLEVGEWVLAIGNPLGQDLSVTSGIVSAKGRQLEGLEVDYQNFIQTDASINQGNSGGPLIDMQGKAVGINSVILSTSGGSIGIGFAIPANMAKKVIEDLKREGRVVRGYIGVQITEIADSEAGQYDLPTGGVLILKVEEGTPAKKAGLKRYDLIVAIDGEKVKSGMDLRRTVANINPGESLKLTIFREKQKKVIDVKVAEAPDSMKIRSDDEDGKVIDLGMVLANNSAALAREYNLSSTEGIVVMEIEQDGVAAQNRLRNGDVIIAVNRTGIRSVRQFREIMSQKSGSTVLLSILRGDSEMFIKFKIPN